MSDRPPAAPRRHEAVVLGAIPTVKARLKGPLKPSGIVAPTSHTLHMDGQGRAAGLHSALPHDSANACVGGKVAPIGSRIVDMAAQKRAAEFSTNFNQALIDKHGAAPANPARAPTPPSAHHDLIQDLIAWL